jgi:putative transposase
MKDELELKSCHRYEELVNNVEKYINYYNNERPQWGVSKKKLQQSAGVFSERSSY